MRKKTPSSASQFQVAPPVDPQTQADLNYLEWAMARGIKPGDLDPLSDDALRLQALYVQHVSQHPMDVVRQVMTNIFSDPKDRLAAAKLLMEYSLRKPAANMEVKTTGSVLSIDASKLSALSTEELETLDKLLSKANA